MLKKLMIGTALTAVALSGAIAQTNDATQSPPAATSGASSDSSQAAPNSSSMMGTTQSGTPQVITAQQSNQWLASKFQGTDVVGNDDKKIGDVADIVFDQNGQVQAYVIGVGGLLGVGAKNVALAPSAFTVIKGDGQNADKLKLSMNKDELKQAQAFEPYRDPNARATTTGQGPGTSPQGGAIGGRPTPSSGVAK
jgi:sporulation protein YlmC with PRC-barrel domain